jgi:hypothetical protein
MTNQMPLSMEQAVSKRSLFDTVASSLKQSKNKSLTLCIKTSIIIKVSKLDKCNEF